MAWVRFPDGSRRKVERISKADAQHDLDELLALRAARGGLPEMAAAGYATSTIHHTWLYLNQAIDHANRTSRPRTPPRWFTSSPARRAQNSHDGANIPAGP